MVGIYATTAGVSHAFVYDGANFTTVDFPGAAGGTAPYGINGSGLIVGFYQLTSIGRYRGFYYDGTTFTTLDDLFSITGTSTGTTPLGVNNAGQIVGSYLDMNHIGHPFVAPDLFIEAISGDGQSANTGMQFANPLKAKVTTRATGARRSGMTVTFAGPTSGAGVTFPASGQAVTDVNGIATLTPTANATGGGYTVNARVTGAPVPATFFSLTNTVSTTLSKTAGDNQSAMTGQIYPTNLKVVVLDEHGMPFPGAMVTFTVVPGAIGASGAFAGTPTQPITTGVDGTATAPVLAANSIAGQFTVIASIGALNATFNLMNITPSPPTSDSATPSAGAGLTQSFAYKYSSVNGFGYLSDVYALFNTSLNGANACFVLFDKATASFYLYNDAGTGIIGPLAPGAAASLSNSQCTLSGVKSSISGFGNTLTMIFNLTFKPAFAGTQTDFMYAADSGGLNSAWQSRGMWTIPVSTIPGADSVTPNSGSGFAQTFTYQYSSVNGFGYLSDVYALFNTSINGANACFVVYDKASNAFYLYNDAGSGLSAALAPGSAASVSNTQCTLSGIGSSISGLGNTLTMVLNLAFTASFFGANTDFMYAVDVAAQSSGWQNRGRWTMGTATPPRADFVTPSSGVGMTQSFTFSYASASGFGYLSDVYALFNTTLNGANACFVVYDSPSGAFYLYNDAGSGVTGPLAPGSGSSLSNSHCMLSGTGSSISGSGDILTMILNLTFNSSFIGASTIFMYAADTGGMVSGWQNRGTWTGSGLPSADSVRPNPGSGATQTFTFAYSSVYGSASLNAVYALFNGSLAAVNACFVYYDPTANLFYLANDGATAWLGALTPGGTGTVQNSQCSINAAATSVRQGGNFFNFAFTVTATPAFGGPQTVFGYAADSGARNSGWRALGTWNAALGLNLKADSAAPNAVTGNAESFTFSYSSSSGFANLGYVWVLIGSNLSLANACYVLYYPGPNTIYLAANDGFSLIGGVMPGFSGTLVV